MLTIVSVVENDEHGLASLMIKSVNKYTPEPHTILIVDNSGENTVLGQYPNVEVIDNTANVVGLIGGSNRHGCGLQTGVKAAETEWVALLDSDTVVLGENWYDMEHSSIAFKRGKEFLHMCFLIMKRESLINRLAPGFPAYSGVSYSVKRDVGWKIERPVEYIDIIFRDCKTDGCYFHGLQCDEIWDIQDNLIATHFGRGSNLKGKADKGFGSHQEQLAKWKAIIKELTGIE